MKHRQEWLGALDAQVDRLLAWQVTDRADPRHGGFFMEPMHVETRAVGFCLADLLAAFSTRESRHFLSAAVRDACQAALGYLERFQRPGGCYDLTPCNYASAPDTAFMLNAVLTGWQIARRCEGAQDLMPGLERLIRTAADGIAAGGFHTPNHRWAIAACLLTCHRFFPTPRWEARARAFLAEGLDINADGEFAERSAGNYNQVNDDQMIRLYLATGEERFLEAAERNLDMMFCYFDPDGSVFTNNSTRQDMGQKIYGDTYYVLYLLVGYLRGRQDFGAMAEWLWNDCRRRGVYPPGIEWVLLMEDMDGYGAQAPFARPMENVNRLFEESCVARVRRGAWSLTLMKNRPNCLYFQHGAMSLYMAVYANLCDRRNFVPQTLERTADGFRLTDHAAGWYYQPFPEPPPTSDWWRMDNASRPKTEGLPLDIALEVRLREDGAELRLHTAGVDRLPLRVELGLLPGGILSGEGFVQKTVPGGCVLARSGMLQAVGPEGEAVVIGPAFGEHFVLNRMGGAYPLSERHHTVLLTDYTPVDRTFVLRSAPQVRSLWNPQA